jgi:hypothetical protein
MAEYRTGTTAVPCILDGKTAECWKGGWQYVGMRTAERWNTRTVQSLTGREQNSRQDFRILHRKTTDVWAGGPLNAGQRQRLEL